MKKDSLQDIENRAVDAAIRSDWDGAVKENLELLKLQKDNVPTLLRLGFAYLQLNKFENSQGAYQKVLKIQPQNAIASEYIEKIEVRKKQSKNHVSAVILDTNMFIELPGKTKTVLLNQLGQKSTLAKLAIGEEVKLVVRKHHCEMRTSADEYIGVLPDDVGVRLMYFIDQKSTYRAHIRESTLSQVTVFIREVEKGPKVAKLVSFPVDIPGSISKVMARQQADEDEASQKTDPNSIRDPDKDEEEVEEEIEEKEDDDLEGELLKDLEGEAKQEVELLGIETEEEEEEE